MDAIRRIRALENKFYKRFEPGADEWSEMFAHAAAFARHLADAPPERPLLDALLAWMKKAAEAECGHDA